MLLQTVGLLAVLVAFSFCAPSGTKYDQRQEGEWNVRADLENFVILIIPTSHAPGAATGTGGGLGLLDLLTKANPFRSHLKRKKHVKKPQQEQNVEEDETALDTEQFLESKTAPYHVDITRSRNNLAKLHPQKEKSAAELLVARSPSIALVKTHDNKEKRAKDHAVRLSKAFIITAPEDLEFLKSNNKREIKEHVVVPKKSSQDKDVEKPENVDGEDLKLLGSGDEQCGPGLKRDSQGICRIIPK